MCEMDYLKLLDDAYYISTFSNDPSTQIGVVIVDEVNGVKLSSGYNRFPAGIKETKERMRDRDFKYKVIIHAEEDAILRAARTGVGLYGSTIISPFGACNICARAIIAAGIKKIVVHESALHFSANIMSDGRKEWAEAIKLANEMFDEAGISKLKLVDRVGCRPVRCGYRLFYP